MVNGMEFFRKKFRDYPDCYTVIGGTACDILMTQADMPFRATKDIDMILILEDRYREFASVFWEFIREGGYRCGWKNSECVHFYRFTEPKSGYPAQIELFSRKPDYHLEINDGIIPIHIQEDVSSLSAILLNEDFYRFMLAGRRQVDGISVLDASYLIPFKMFAWIDLTDRKARGEHVNERDLKKHKNDVFRLLEIVPNDAVVPVSGMVSDCVCIFLDRIQSEEISLSQLGLSMEKDEAIALLKAIYPVE